MRITRGFAAVLAALMLAAVSFAATIEGPYAGCLTKDSLDEMIKASSEKDIRQINALLGVSCVLIEGREYSVVERGFLKSRIRVYVGEDSVLLWTVSDAIK